MHESAKRQETIKRRIVDAVVSEMEIPHSPSMDRVARFLVEGLLNSPAVEIHWNLDGYGIVPLWRRVLGAATPETPIQQPDHQS